MEFEPKTITLSIELKEEFYQCVQKFLADNPSWNRQQLINVSLSRFLSQTSQFIQLEDYQSLARLIYCLTNDKLDNYHNFEQLLAFVDI